MKKFVTYFLFIAFITFLLIPSGCSAKKSYTPFPINDQELKGPEKPIEKWTYTWETDTTDSNSEFTSSGIPVGVWKDPTVDNSGIVYFSDFQDWLKLSGNIYSLSQNGKLLWKRPKTLTMRMVGLVSGFLNIDPKNAIYYDQENSVIKTYPIRNAFLGQDKMLYGIQSQKNWLLSIKNFFTRWWYFWFFGIGHVYNIDLISMDYNGKVLWKYTLPETSESSRIRTQHFSDTLGNVYFIWGHDFYSLTSTGKLRWRKEFPTKHFAGEDYGIQFDLISNQQMAGNSFLVSETKIPTRLSPEYYLQCLSTMDGNILWELKMKEDSELKVPYAMLDEITYLVPIQDTKFDRTFLQAISSIDGKVIWEKEIDSSHCTSPIVDSEGNIYIGAGGADKKPRTIYSYTRSGTLRLSMVQTNPDQAFGTNLVLGPNHTLYYGLQGINLLYCIGEK